MIKNAKKSIYKPSLSNMCITLYNRLKTQPRLKIDLSYEFQKTAYDDLSIYPKLKELREKALEGWRRKKTLSKNARNVCSS